VKALFAAMLLGWACSGDSTGPRLRSGCLVSCPLAFAQRNAGIWDIFTISAFGTELRNLTRDTITDIWPSWSPDRRQIAFVSERPNLGIYLMNADGSNIRFVFSWAPAHIAWSPDGRRLAFDAGEIQVVNTDGTGLLNLTTSLAFERKPDWSPHGDRIAYTRENEIWVMDASGTDQRSLTGWQSQPAFDPAWSPDGSRIAFASVDASNHTTLWVMNAEGRDWRRLTDTTGGEDRLPEWSPNGAEIAFQRAFYDSTVIRIVSADGLRQRRLVGGISGHVSW